MPDKPRPTVWVQRDHESEYHLHEGRYFLGHPCINRDSTCGLVLLGSSREGLNTHADTPDEKDCCKSCYKKVNNA